MGRFGGALRPASPGFAPPAAFARLARMALVAFALRTIDYYRIIKTGCRGRQMHPTLRKSTPLDPTLEIDDVARTLREIEWLLVVLVLLLYVLHEPLAEASFSVAVALCTFTACIAVINYVIPQHMRNRWIVAFETWLMIAFITWILYFTAGPGRVVAALYLLPIVVTALVLGRGVTMLQVALIAACYLFVGRSVDYAFFTPSAIGHFAVDIAPMLLVAYTTSMLSGDIVNAMNRVKATSDTDELTGLYNIRGFNALAKHEFGQAARYNRGFSIMMIDADRLKQVNDTYGHSAGDRMIQIVAHVIHSAIKSTDVVARYGGDEFVCLLPAAGQQAATHVAERIRQRLADEPLVLDHSKVAITISVGIASYPAHGHTLDDISKSADRALYVSKARGRDRVTVYDEVAEDPRTTPLAAAG
jgi:diguanylate cyclase (GGDEF)-like protein